MSELEELKEKLYQKGSQLETKKESLPKPPQPPKKIPVGWEDESRAGRPKKPSSLFSLIVITAVIVIGISGFFIYRWYNIQGEIAINIIGPTQVRAGEPTSYRINVKNNLSAPLQGAQLAITLGDNITFLNNIGSKFLKFSLGNLTVGQDFNQDIQVVFTGSPNSVSQVTATVDYGLTNLSGNFERSNNLSISIGSQTLQADFNLPQKALSSRPFSFSFKIQNITSNILPSVHAQMNFPQDLTILNSSLPSQQLGIWQFDNLNPGEIRTVKFTGVFNQSQANQAEQFQSSLSMFYQNLPIQLGTSTASLTIQPFPIYLGISLQLNHQDQTPDYIIKAGDFITYVIKFKNTESVALQNVVIKAKLQSQMFDYKSLQTTGAYSSIDNTIVFNASNTPLIANFATGLEGSVGFTLKTLSNYPINNLNDKNFTAKVSADLSSTTIPPDIGITDNILTVNANTQNRVAGNLALVSKIYFYDPGPFLTNSGPLPLKVNQPTTFTIHWLFKASADDFSNIFIKTFLPANVIYTGKSSSQQGYQLSYNDRTQELDLQIPQLSANTGVVNNPIDFTFQIQVTPNANQISRTVTLLNETDITATNNYTGQSISLTIPGRDSNAFDDPKIPYGAGLVQQ